MYAKFTRDAREVLERVEALPHDAEFSSDDLRALIRVSRDLAVLRQRVERLIGQVPDSRPDQEKVWEDALRLALDHVRTHGRVA